MSQSTLTTVQAGRAVRLTRAELAALRDLRELRGQPRKAAPPPPPEPEVAPTKTLAQQLAAGPAPGRPGSLRGQLQARRQARVRTAQAAPVLDAPAAQDSEPAPPPAVSMLTQFRRLRGGRK